MLENVSYASTAGAAISIPFADVELTVTDTLVSVSQPVLTTNSSFILTQSGTFVSAQPLSGNAALYMNGVRGTAQIDGTMVAQQTIGILCDGSTIAFPSPGH